MAIHATPSVDVKSNVRRTIELTIGILKNGIRTQEDHHILDNCFTFVTYMRHGIAVRGTWAPPLREFTDKERFEARETDRQYAEVMATLDRARDEVYEGLARNVAVAYIIAGFRRVEKHRPVPEQVVQFFEKVHEYLSEDWAHVEESETAPDT